MTIAVITALPIETFAVRSVLDDVEEYWSSDDPNYYFIGTLPGLDAVRRHVVAVAQQARDGTRNAAAVSADLARTFPNLRVLVMCGIAGGVPEPSEKERGVHLGDIVVATDGVVDYDHVRSVDGSTTPRRPLSPPSTALLRVDDRLNVAELDGRQPWLPIIEKLSATPVFRRPDSDTDPLNVVASLRRTDDRPRVHRGLIGSADRLLRDASLRDDLARRHKIKAVEMEASGVAVAAELYQLSWFMVRGVADYCDNSSKNDVWHPYAALVAAAYVRSLLVACRPEKVPEQPPPHDPAKPDLQGLGAIVDVLLGVPQIQEEPGRRTVIRQLPRHVASSVTENPNPRIHVLHLVQACAEFPDGADQLISAVTVVLGTESPGLRRIESVIRQHWPKT